MPTDPPLPSISDYATPPPRTTRLPIQSIQSISDFVAPPPLPPKRVESSTSNSFASSPPRPTQSISDYVPSPPLPPNPVEATSNGFASSSISGMKFGDVEIEVRHGGIVSTELGVDAITNAANTKLSFAGHQGIAVAIAQAAGAPELKRECEKALNRLGAKFLPGSAVWTSSCKLEKITNIRYIVHAVAPQFSKNEERDVTYKSAVYSALRVATELKCKSLAMPLLGSGVFQWESAHASRLLAEALCEWLKSNSR
jgi:O-acetyl-ADP-ribose deacetylase (regulator of RNase III)